MCAGTTYGLHGAAFSGIEEGLPSDGVQATPPPEASMTRTRPAIHVAMALLVALAQAACGGGGEPPVAGSPTATPTNLVASHSSGTSIHLAWTNHAVGATGILVERSTAAAGPFEPVVTSPGTASSADDAGLVVSTRYAYRVTALSGAASGTPSAVVTVDPPPIPDPPAAPTGVMASLQPGSTLKVDWTHPGTNVKGFMIERRRDVLGFEYAKVADLTADLRTYVDPCLSPGSPFLYRVTAFNEVGSAAAVTPTSTTTPAPGAAPDLGSGPHGLTATLLNADSYRIEWTNACSSADRILVEYADGPNFDVWRNRLGSSFLSSDTTWFTDVGLPQGMHRKYRLSGRNVYGSTDYSNLVQVDGPAAAPPPTGGSMAVYADYDNTVVVTDLVPALDASVSSSGGLAAGCSWFHNAVLSMQDFMCYAAAIHFPLQGTSTAGGAFDLAGTTIDRALLSLDASGLSVTPSTLSLSGIATAWDTATLSGGTSLALSPGGAVQQGRPASLGLYVLDVTAIVQAWASGALENDGLLLQDADRSFPSSDSIRTSLFHSTDSYAGDPKKRPTLWVDFH